MNAHELQGQVIQKSPIQYSLMMLREGKTALDGVILSTIPSTELAGNKECARNTNTKTRIHNPIQRFPQCAETKLLDIPKNKKTSAMGNWNVRILAGPFLLDLEYREATT
jgi:hypothetical protein